MVFTWMLYCTSLSALLGLGALALERALGAAGRPTRWVWAAAVVASALLPFALPALLELRSALLDPPAVAVPSGGGFAGEPIPGGAPAARESALRAADRLLLPAWFLASGALLVAGSGMAAVLHLRRRGWLRATVAGAPVLVSPRTGPAVVGFVRGSIVLPAWALEWDEERQRMMVEHEREHLRARDPLLLLLGLAAVAAVPWNAALWWQLRRLRLALEVDCDARVLRGSRDVRAYGLLLLEVGRAASAGRIPALALTEPRSFLERRIRTMTSRNVDHRFRRAALAACVCAGVLGLAAALPVPAAEPPVPGLALALAAAPRSAPDTVPLRRGVIDVSEATEKPTLVNGLQLQRLLAIHYPPRLREAGVAGTVEVAMVITEGGAVTDVRALGAPDAAFAEAALEVMGQARFRPARLDGRPVAVRVQLPVAFSREVPAGAVPIAPHAPDAAPPAPAPDAPPAAAAPAAPGGGEVDVSALDVKPTLRNAAEVQAVLVAGYPPALRDAGVGGAAQVAFVVTAGGGTRDVRLVSATHEAFGEPAMAAVRAMRFVPGRLAGRAIAARVQIPVQFSPEKAEPAAPPRGR